jgi:serine protease inhibitor
MMGPGISVRFIRGRRPHDQLNALATFQANGFRAAAVTATGAIAGAVAPPPSHRAKHIGVDFVHPFGFLTVDRRSRLILTAGWVAEPGTWDPEADDSPWI